MPNPSNVRVTLRYSSKHDCKDSPAGAWLLDAQQRNPALPLYLEVTINGEQKGVAIDVALTRDAPTTLTALRGVRDLWSSREFRWAVVSAKNRALKVIRRLIHVLTRVEAERRYKAGVKARGKQSAARKEDLERTLAKYPHLVPGVLDLDAPLTEPIILANGTVIHILGGLE